MIRCTFSISGAEFLAMLEITNDVLPDFSARLVKRQQQSTASSRLLADDDPCLRIYFSCASIVKTDGRDDLSSALIHAYPWVVEGEAYRFSDQSRIGKFTAYIPTLKKEEGEDEHFAEAYCEIDEDATIGEPRPLEDYRKSPTENSDQLKPDAMARKRRSSQTRSPGKDPDPMERPGETTLVSHEKKRRS